MPLSRQFTAANSERLFRATEATLETGDIDFTIKASFYVDLWGGTIMIAAKGLSGTDREWVLFKEATNQITFRAYGAGGAAVGSATSAAAVGPGWHTAVGYHDAANNLVGLAIDEIDFVTAATTGACVVSTGAFQIGAHASGTPAGFWDGRIARVGFWKSRVFTNAEASQIHNNGKSYLYAGLPAALSSGLTCWWDLDEVSGNATDEVGGQTLTDGNTVTSNRGPDDSPVYLCCGYELGTGVIETEAITGTAAVQSVVARSGTYAYQFNPTTTAVGWHALRGWTTAALKSATSTNTILKSGFFRGYFRYATAPSADNEQILLMMSDADTAKLGLRIVSTGALAVYDEVTPALLATSTTILAADTWYRIEVGVVTGTGVWEARIYANDNNPGQAAAVPLETLTGSRDQLADEFSYVRLGKHTDKNGETIDCFWDDCAIGDNWIGAGKVGVLLVDSAGTTNTFNSGTFADVDENPHDTDTTFLATTSGVASQVFTGNMQAVNSLNSSSINLVQPIVIARKVAGTLTFQNRFISGASTTTSVAGAMGTAYQGHPASFYRDPDTLAPWTIALVNAIECGCVLATSDNVCRVTSIVALVDYIAQGAVHIHPIGIGKRPPKSGGGNEPAPSQNFIPIPPGVMGFEGTGAPYTPDQGGNPTLLSEGVYWHTGLFSEGPYVGVGWSSTTNLTDGSANDTTTRETSGDASISILTVGAGDEQLDQLIAMLRYKGNVTEVYKEWTGSAYEDIPIDIAAAFPPNATYTDGSGTTIFDTNSETIRLYQFTESDAEDGGMSASDIRETLS